jgi:hypothetical protein
MVSIAPDTFGKSPEIRITPDSDRPLLLKPVIHVNVMMQTTFVFVTQRAIRNDLKQFGVESVALRSRQIVVQRWLNTTFA